MAKGKPIRLSPYEEVFLEVRADMQRRDLHALFCAHFGRDDVTLGALCGLMKRKGWGTGRTGCFIKGQVPPNKGKPMPAETRAKVAATMFQPGTLNGKAAKLWKPIGTERLCKDGYLERKLRDDGPPKDRWRAVHILEWERARGPVPKGHALKCLDGDRTNTDPSNWEAV